MNAVETEARPRAQVTDVDLHIVAFCCHFCAYAAADLAGAENNDLHCSRSSSWVNAPGLSEHIKENTWGL